MSAISRNKTILLCAFGCAFLFAAIIVLVPAIRGRAVGWFRGEAFFDGQPASVWGRRLESDAAGDNAAFEQLKNGGRAAVPVIMAIAFADSGPQSQAQALLVSHGEAVVGPLIKLLKKSTSEERRQVAAVLGAIGPKAKPAVESLIRLLDDDDEPVREAGMKALENIGPQAAAAVPDLTLILEGKGKAATASWRLQAVRALGKIGPSARTAVPALTACLGDPDMNLVREACLVLGGLGREAVPAVPALIEVLKNRPPARDAAVRALGMIGPGAKQAVPILIATLRGTNSQDLREVCKVSLAKMGAEARPAVAALLAAFGKAAPVADIGPAAVPELVQLLANPGAADQAAVHFFLVTFRKEAGPALIEALHKDKDPRLRATVAALLGPAWGEAARMVPALLRALEDRDDGVREAARNSIVVYRKEAQPFLDRQLRGKNDAQRLEAIQLFGRLGTEARSSARFLLLVLKEDNPALRPALVYALGRMEYHPKEAVPVLIEELKARRRTEATLALLAAHGRGAKDALPLVCGLLHEADANIRRQAAFAFEKIGVDKDVALPHLIKALADKNGAVRAAVAQALGSARILKDEVVPVLLKCLADPSAEVRTSAILALGRFGPAAKSAVPVIHKMARAGEETPDNENMRGLRVACVVALGALGPASQEAAPLLLSWLTAARSEGMTWLLVEALGRMEAKVAAKAIESLMQTPTRAATAALALWRIQRSPAALQFLQDGLKDRAACGPYVVALGEVGPAAGKSVPVLSDILLRDPDLGQRARAAAALGRMGAIHARPALKVLVASLRAPDARVRSAAAGALAQFDEDARDASPRLVELLNDPESPQVRAAAADALQRIDPEAAADAGIL
jgi:HEAT repeat protein